MLWVGSVGIDQARREGGRGAQSYEITDCSPRLEERGYCGSFEVFDYIHEMLTIQGVVYGCPNPRHEK